MRIRKIKSVLLKPRETVRNPVLPVRPIPRRPRPIKYKAVERFTTTVLQKEKVTFIQSYRKFKVLVKAITKLQKANHL